MVRLTKIYTRTGDSGTTGLGSGVRVSKADPRVEAYGTVDEANAAVGVAVIECQRDERVGAAGGPIGAQVAELLRGVQHDLFDAGADLCVPMLPGEKGEKLRITAGQTERIEKLIDRYNDPLGPLSSFVLPGGSPASAALHVARTVTRRAERLVVALMDREAGATNAEVVKYLNRLSDLLFVLGRVMNGNGSGDVLWKPGSNR